ncbi:MAG: hypothetical protein BMS9Abin19_0916 [Gammaproteobacteria bacterium]|nr:MAG: hypothetical protein BMS9Abin19_0916 [Gammaproteobacteria bacterium]
MKFILMLLILLVLSDAVLADQNNNNAECLKMYRNYMKDHSISRSQMFYFLDSCMPADSAVSDEAQHQKLLQIIDNDEKIMTIKT